MTRLEFLLAQRDWCTRMAATPLTLLPGSLTHQKVNDLAEETENELVEFAVCDANGKISYKDNEER